MRKGGARNTSRENSFKECVKGFQYAPMFAKQLFNQNQVISKKEMFAEQTGGACISKRRQWSNVIGDKIIFCHHNIKCSVTLNDYIVKWMND